MEMVSIFYTSTAFCSRAGQNNVCLASDDQIEFAPHEMQFKSLMSVFQAEDDLDAHEWMEAIQGVTACLLNGNVDIEALSKAQPKPSKPTHSRQGSRAGKPTPTPTPTPTTTWCILCS